MSRMCEHKGCRAILSPRNKGDLCAWHKSSSRQELTCKAYSCDEFITKNNKSGYCRKCKMQVWRDQNTHRVCSDCSSTLHHCNRSGVCGVCRSLRRQRLMRTCACGQKIDHRNKTGICFACMYPGASRSSERKHVIAPRAPYTVKELARTAAFLTCSTMEELAGISKIKRITRIRFAVWNLAEPHYSYNQIGMVFGNRDHTTIIHGCQRAADFLETDRNFRILVDMIKRETLARREMERKAA